MLSPIGSALSGLSAASTRVSVAADNIANQFSKDYVPKQVTQVSLQTGGTQARVLDVTPATTPVFNPSDPEANADGTVSFPNVDLATELVNLTIASYDYKANLKSIKVANELHKSLLDIFS